MREGAIEVHSFTYLLLLLITYFFNVFLKDCSCSRLVMTFNSFSNRAMHRTSVEPSPLLKVGQSDDQTG